MNNCSLVRLPGVLIVFILGTLVSNVSASFKENPQYARTESPKQILYQVTSENLAGMKDALVNINLHLRKNSDQAKPKVMIAITGPGIELFRIDNTDPELEYMLRWFYEEDVTVGVSKHWLEKLQMVPNDLAEGLAVLEFK